MEPRLLYPYPGMGTVGSVSGYRDPHPSGVRLRFKLDRYRELAKGKGWTTQAEHAAGSGLSQQTVSRMFQTDWKPSPDAIAALLASLKVDFSDLFEVVSDQAPARRAS